MDLHLFLVVIAETVIEKVSLPFDLLLCREKMFPVGHGLLHSWLARECHDGMKMIGHQKHEPTVPGGFGMIMRGGGKDRIADASATNLIRAAFTTVDGDEEE
jgi:hypothetical protein